MYRILAVNPGSTSTKIAVFEDEANIMSVSIHHPDSDLAGLATFKDQYKYRKRVIIKTLEENRIPLDSISAVVGRGGIMHPVKAGAYLVNDLMKNDLENCPKYNASNLGAALADELGEMANALAYIYDSVAVDEMWDLARLTGLPGMERTSIGHVLNMRAAAMHWAKENNRPYEKCTIIVAHLGGGITVSLQHNGRLVDMISDDEGAFAPERSGLVPARKMIQYLYDKNLNRQQAYEALQGKNAGLHGLIGTADTIEVERRIAAGDQDALLCYEAMAFNVAKTIGQLATEVSGKIDRIILTGGTAYSPQFTGWIRERVSYIAPIEIIPGEREMEAMAMGILRVLQGKDKAKVYRHEERPPLLKR